MRDRLGVPLALRTLPHADPRDGFEMGMRGAVLVRPDGHVAWRMPWVPSDPARALVEECTGTIIGEVESLKGLVDEFSQFARMPTPRPAPAELAARRSFLLALHRRHAGRLRALFYWFGADLEVIDDGVLRSFLDLE